MNRSVLTLGCTHYVLYGDYSYSPFLLVSLWLVDGYLQR